MKTAMVWPLPPPKVDLDTDVFIGTHYLAAICGLGYLWWANGQSVPESVHDYDCFIVNLFAGGNQAVEIRTAHPTAFIIALPDNAFEQVFTHDSIHDMQFLQQLQAADAIGFVSNSNRYFYGGLFPDKALLQIPMPIGHKDFFKEVRKQEKEDFIITCDHAIFNGDKVLIDASCIQNVAAVAAVQRATGLRVIYANAAPKTREYAEFVGLRATFTAYLNFATYAELSARARLGIDMYTLHGFGRNTLMWAYAGTPAVGSTYTHFKALYADPWDIRECVESAQYILNDAYAYEHTRSIGIGDAYNNHGYKACRELMNRVLGQVELWRLQLPS